MISHSTKSFSTCSYFSFYSIAGEVCGCVCLGQPRDKYQFFSAVSRDEAAEAAESRREHPSSAVDVRQVISGIAATSHFICSIKQNASLPITVYSDLSLHEQDVPGSSKHLRQP